MGTRSDELEFYVDEAGEHRWRYRNPDNGEIVGAASEGFSSEAIARRNVDLLGEAIVSNWEIDGSDAKASSAGAELNRRRLTDVALLLNKMQGMALDGASAHPTRVRRGIKIDLAYLTRTLGEMLARLYPEANLPQKSGAPPTSTEPGS